jgi:hypothetical protein
MSARKVIKKGASPAAPERAAVANSDEPRNSGRPNLRFRTALAVLFASCGIWILAFGLGWLREPIPVTSKWAWSAPATFVFFRLAAAVWIGFGVTSIYGTGGQVVVDCIFATVYLATSAALLLKERLGIWLALGISLISAAALVLTDLPFIVDPKSRVSTLQFGVTTAVAVSYSVLAYILGKAQMSLWRLRWTRVIKSSTSPK